MNKTSVDRAVRTPSVTLTMTVKQAELLQRVLNEELNRFNRALMAVGQQKNSHEYINHLQELIIASDSAITRHGIDNL